MATSITVVTPWLDAHELIPGYQRAVTVLGDDDRLVIVDNGSTPAIPDAAIRLPTNHGFSKACNFGLDAATTDAVLFLNNDIRMTSATWLQQIRQALKPGVLVGARLRTDAHTAVDGVAVPYLDGWCIAGMTAELLALGGWNEAFTEPAYYGDNELCVRAQAAGMRLVAVPVGLQHLGNYTSRRMDVTGVSARNRERYVEAVREWRQTGVAA